MSTQKRARACDPCHAIKIKCELGTTGGNGPCSRCVRLEKECIITPPKRQKDRVAELEAQVEALTKLLQSQQIQTPPEPTETQGPSAGNRVNDGAHLQPLPQKKRRLQEDPRTENVSSQKPMDDKSIMLDTEISKDMQQYILTKYLNEITSIFPLVPITGDCSYEGLRKTRPILLQAIVYAACPGMIPITLQEDISKVLMNIFASAAIAEGKRSLELVQAIQLTVLWYRSPKSHGHVSVFQLAQLGAGIAEDIALGGPLASPSLGFYKIDEDPGTLDARRTWLVTHLISANMAVLMRRPNTKVWNEYDEKCLYILEHSHLALPDDRIVSQYIRIERLCERIASQLDYYNFSDSQDILDPATQVITSALQDQITSWKAQTPLDLVCPTLKFLEHVAILYLHESVLHTSTNKQTFSAPFMADRLSATDFPAPMVSPEHITSLHALKAACHDLLDVFLTISVSSIVALPAVLFTSRVAYAAYILLKLYIACTANGNTFGAFMDPESLRLEQYLEKLIEVAMKVREVDERSGPARILSVKPMLKKWLLEYKEILAEQTVNSSPSEQIDTPTSDQLNLSASAKDVSIEWDTFLQDNEMGFGFDDLFADPLQDYSLFTSGMQT